MDNRANSKFKYFIVLPGVLLIIGTEFMNGRLNMGNMGFAIISMFPYGVYYLASLKVETKSLGAVVGGGILILGIDILIRIQVFFFPSSSTDAIALLWLPVWQLVVLIPVGFLLGWFVEKIINRIRLKA